MGYPIRHNGTRRGNGTRNFMQTPSDICIYICTYTYARGKRVLYVKEVTRFSLIPDALVTYILTNAIPAAILAVELTSVGLSIREKSSFHPPMKLRLTSLEFNRVEIFRTVCR